jgi:hypothetical protein
VAALLEKKILKNHENKVTFIGIGYFITSVCCFVDRCAVSDHNDCIQAVKQGEKRYLLTRGTVYGQVKHHLAMKL